jgi:hypothetical protein
MSTKRFNIIVGYDRIEARSRERLQATLGDMLIEMSRPYSIRYVASNVTQDNKVHAIYFIAGTLVYNVLASFVQCH